MGDRYNRLRTCLQLIASMIILVFTMNVMANDRMPPIPADQMTKLQKEAVEEFKKARNTTKGPFGPFVPLLRSPEMLSRVRNVGDYVRFNNVLPGRLSEFVILITARHWTQQYEWAVHSAIAERAGLGSSVIDAVADGRRPDQMMDDEAVVYDFCTELLNTQSVSDRTYARAVSLFAEKGVIDAIGILGYYSMLAMIMNTAHTPLDEGMSLALPTFPR